MGTLIYGSCCYFEASNPPIHTWWKHFRNQKIMAHLKSLLYREISWERHPMKYFGIIIFCTPLFIENSVFQKIPKFHFQSQFSKSKIIWICVIFFLFKNVSLVLTLIRLIFIKPSISTYSKPCTRLLTCFV